MESIDGSGHLRTQVEGGIDRVTCHGEPVQGSRTEVQPARSAVQRGVSGILCVRRFALTILRLGAEKAVAVGDRERV